MVTGTLENFTREEAQEKLRLKGYKVTSSVSSKTDIVVAGKNPGSKLDKALQFGVKIIKEEDFIKMLEG